MWWFRDKTNPVPVTPSRAPALPSAPPEFVKGDIAFTRAGKSWTESFDVVQIAERVLGEQGRFATRVGNELSLDTSGYVLKPVMTSFKPLDKGGVQTVTIMRVSHPEMVPRGLFEYQHSVGDSIDDSVAKGLEQWAQMDLVALLEATEAKPATSMVMEMTLPADENRPTIHRRAILGPCSRTIFEQPDPALLEAHRFCPCCLLTQSLAAFKSVVESDKFIGIRFFAMRGKDGEVSADCRINGEEFEPGKAALRKYVQTWPDQGVEFRKQYVVVQTIKARSEDADSLT